LTDDEVAELIAVGKKPEPSERRAAPQEL